MDNNTNNDPVQPDVRPEDVQLGTQPDVQSVAPMADQPVVTSSETVLGSAAQPAPKKKKTGLIIGLIATVLLIGGLVGGYFWYQSPNKILTDAINNSYSAKVVVGKMKLGGLGASSSSDMMGFSLDDIEIELAADLNAMSFDYNMTANLELMGQKAPIKAKMMFVDKKDIYFRLEDLSKVVDGMFDSFASTFGSEMSAEFNKIKQQFSPVVTKLENKWIKISVDDFKSDDEDDKALVCLTDYLKNFDTNKYMEQSKAALKENNFYKAGEVKTVDGNFVMAITIDKDKMKAYSEKLAESDMVKGLKKCSEMQEPEYDVDTDDYDMDITFDDEDFGDFADEDASGSKEPEFKNVELIITKWDHKIKGFKAGVESSSTGMSGSTTQTTKLEMSLDWPKTVDIKAPADAIGFEEWLKSIQEEAAKLESGATGIGGSGGISSLFF